MSISETCRTILPFYVSLYRCLAPAIRVTSHYPKSPLILKRQANFKLLTPICSKCYCTQIQRPGENELDELYRQVTIEVKGHDKSVLNSYTTFALTAAAHLDVKVADVKTPDMHIHKWTLLKSPHIFKKHRVQYEARTHYKTITFKHLTGSTADTYLEYIQRNLPEGMAMKVTKHRIEALPDHLLSQT